MSDERLLDFSRALSAAVRSGLPLSDAFQTLSKSRAHGKLIAGAAKLTSGGTELYKALNAQKIFPPVFIALIRAGEEGGKVDEFLDLYAGCLEVRVEFRRRIGRALIYPVFVLLLTGALFLAASLKVVPMILEPLLSAGIKVPPPAPWLSLLVGTLQAHWPLILALVFISLLALRAFLRSGPGRKLRALAEYLVPGLRYATEHARFYHTYTILSLLLKAGLPLSAMMDVLLQFSQDDLIAHRRFTRASTMSACGIGFSASFEGCIPEEDKCALEIAEKAGRIEETLLRLGKTHYDKHLHRLKVLSTACTILATVALAPLCFGLILTLIRPVFTSLGGMKDLSPGGGSFGPASPGGTPAPGRARAQQGSPGFKAVDDAEAALFNKTHGKEILEYMKAHAPKAKKKKEPVEQQEGTAAPKLGPRPSIKQVQFQSIAPTSIQPTDTTRH